MNNHPHLEHILVLDMMRTGSQEVYRFANIEYCVRDDTLYIFGTNDRMDYLMNLMYDPVDLGDDLGLLHTGYYLAATALMAELDDMGYLDQITMTSGHSAGAALAAIVAGYLLIPTVGFGCPPYADASAQRAIHPTSVFYEVDTDLVPKLRQLWPAKHPYVRSPYTKKLTYPGGIVDRVISRIIRGHHIPTYAKALGADKE